MVVVGGRHSANTKELTRLCEIVGHAARSRSRTPATSTDPAPFDGARVVGVTGGTSTPIEDLRDVAERILELAGTDSRPAPTPTALARGALDAAAHPGRSHHLAAGTLDRRRRRRGLSRGRPLRRPAGRRLRRAPERRQVHAVQPRRRRRARGDRRGPRPDDARPPVRRRRVERPAVRGRRHGRARDRARRPDRGAGPAPGAARDQRGRRDRVPRRRAIGPTPADQEAAELLRRTTKPVLVAANKADNEQRELDAAEFYAFGWEDTFAISASHGRGVADLLDAVVWALPPESRGGDRAQGPRGRGRGVGEGDGRAAGSSRSWWRGRPRTTTTATDDDDGDEAGRASRPIGRPLGRDDGRRGRRAARDRVRRPAERRQVEPAQRAPGRDADDRVRHAGHDPRRHRHDDPVGPERGRAHRHRGHPAARQGRVRAGRGASTRRCARSRRSRAPTSRCSSSTPPTA